MKRVTAIAAAIVAMFALAAIAGAASGTESAQGGYTLFGGQQDFAFSAKATLQNTNASGHFKWTFLGSDPNTVLQGDVTCLIVGPARTAILGGVVTSYTGPLSSTAAHSFFLSVKDNGQGPTALASDTSSGLFLSNAPATDATCVLGTTPAQFPISSGDITVKPALP